MGLPKLPMSKLPVLQSVRRTRARHVDERLLDVRSPQARHPRHLAGGRAVHKAHDSLENSDYAGATKAYQRLIARFPSGPYNEQAQLDLAYSQYKDNQPDEAYSTVNRFIKTLSDQQTR
jgi:outer membrane protein assembly factor BamD